MSFSLQVVGSLLNKKESNLSQEARRVSQRLQDLSWRTAVESERTRRAHWEEKMRIRSDLERRAAIFGEEFTADDEAVD